MCLIDPDFVTYDGCYIFNNCIITHVHSAVYYRTKKGREMNKKEFNMYRTQARTFSQPPLPLPLPAHRDAPRVSYRVAQLSKKNIAI